MLKPQKVIVKWHPNNIQYYTEKGYVYTKVGLPLEINVEDIIPTSKTEVHVICDLCGKEFKVSMSNYTRSMNNSGSVVCKDCKTKKTQNTLMVKYGVNSPSQIDDFAQKTKETCLEKYGVENPMQLQAVQNKVKNSLLKHYGVEYPLLNSELKEKAQNTCLERYGSTCCLGNKEIREKVKNTLKENYGVENPGLSEELVAKAKATCLVRYGGESSQSDPNVRAKTCASLQNHQGLPTSKKERELLQMFVNLYGEECCKPLVVVDDMCYDGLLIIDDIKIDIEYDGWYWHRNKQEKDKRRDYYNMRKGYKVLRVISNGSLPTMEQIKNGVDYLVNSEHHIYKIILDNIDI